MRIVGTVTFPDRVLKYFDMDERRREIQLEDDSVVNRQKFEYFGKTIDLQELPEKGSIYKYVVDNKHLFMESWFENILKVDCLFRQFLFVENKVFYTCCTGSEVYKLNYNSKKQSVMFTGLSTNKCFPDVVPLGETQEYFNMLYDKKYRVKEHQQWNKCTSEF